MQNLKLIIISLISIFGLSTHAETHSELIELCRSRVNIIEKELMKVLLPVKYGRKYSKVKSSMNDLGISAENYRTELESLHDILEKQNHEINSIECLLRTSALLVGLDNVAASGGKNLNDFSNTWKSYFPGQAKKLRYIN